MLYTDLFSPSKIKLMFEAQGIRPRRRWGQNFLIDRNIAEKVIVAQALQTTDTVVEIGAGLGVFTWPLAERVDQVMAYEIDPELVKILSQVTAERSNLEIKTADILKSDFALAKDYRIFGNLPYYIAPRIIRNFLTAPRPPATAFIIIQKEVGERICAPPGELSILSLSVQYFAVPKIIFKISRNAFWPQPNVDSVLLEIKPCPDEPDPTITPTFFALVKAGFASRRKYLISNVQKHLGQTAEFWQNRFSELNLDPRVRAQDLTREQWILLAQQVNLPRAD